jgi:chromosome segregation ATPase
VNERLELALLARLRAVVRNESASEGELRVLGDEADARVRGLQREIEASERRLQRLDADPASSIAEIATELRRLDELRAERTQLTALAAQLDERSRSLRTEWLSRQTQGPVKRP